ncbi:MAG: diguanylate cyclase [Elusimicrobia bacterium]|nr:MAG: diguanylate cyclase [Elusimicrobiota bacterium]KAF0155108.1 MAG: diguanylate cyclase [Elusimicrobiota bacterium]
MPESEIALAALSALWLPALILGRLGRAAAPLAAAAGAGLFWLALPAAGSPAALAVPALWAAASCYWVLSRRQNGPSGAGARQASAEQLKEAGERLALAKKEFNEAGGREKKVLLLYSAMKYLAEAVDHQAAGRQFARYIGDYFGTEDFAFYLLGSAGEAELFACGRDSSSGFNSPEGLRRAAGLPGKGPPEPFAADGKPPKAGVMVSHAGEPVGFFAAAFPSAAPAAELAASMTSFAGEIAFAVRRLRLFREVEWLSRVDGLTGVFRRGVLDERIDEEVRRAQAFRTTFALLIADIDHFKRLNDGYGHQFGDFVLKRVGTLLRESVYETDFVGRYGGEEFAVLLPRAEPEGVLRKAEAIRARIEAENFSHGLESVRISVSIGVAHFPRDGRDAAGAVAAADAALYRAKESGRNRVVDASQL